MTSLRDKIQNALDECRMLILGGQVLISVSAESVYEPGFPELSAAGRWACALAMAALVFAVGLLMWPAAYHRIVSEGDDSPALHRFATRMLCLALPPIAIGLGASMFVVGERASGMALALALGAGVPACAMSTWYGVPMLWNARARQRNDEPTEKNMRTPVGDKVRQVLTEARMVLPGAQALLGFGSIAVLMDAFKELPPTLKVVHTAGVCFIAVAVILLMTPAAYHRLVEDGEQTERFHRVASRLLLLAMAALAPGLSAAVWIVMERVSGSRAVGVTAAMCALAMFYGCWFGWTGVVRRHRAGS
ncbi:MAG TPA: DUF6328 family protein [Phycisphaerales bacterium]|nr:DUF6328 family protein [Phycisphaerales bacterium]